MVERVKSVVPKRDPWLGHGGKVPVGKIPAHARPAMRHTPSTAAEPHSADLAAVVSAEQGFYDWDGTRSLLHLSNSELEAAVSAKTVLCLHDGEGTPVFPSWQFVDSGKVLPFLPSILLALADGIADPWTWALWLTSPSHGDDGESAVDLLASGSDPRPILFDAQRDAAQWAT